MANRLNHIIKRRNKTTGKLYYKNIEYPVIPETPNDLYIISKSTDRLDLLANDYYGDHKLWWIISKANPNKVKRDTLFLEPGMQIRIPENFQKIYSDFKKINK